MAYLERSRLQPCPKITKLYGIAVGVIGFSFAFAPALVDAAPMEGAITGGNASIHHSGVSTDIIQTTDKAIIDWQSFDATAGERVNFNQPSAQSVTLNRIHDSKPTNFDGSLNANGQVWLTNPHGMLFGNNARVDVGGLLATSSDIANADFMAGKNAFTKPGDAEAQIINRGRITTSNGGSVALLAPHVANEGQIESKLGKVQLGGGDIAVVDLYGDGLINLEITHATPTVDNSGIIIAEEGSVTLHAKQGLATDSGTIDVSGGKGGRIDLLGDHVGLLAHSTLNASGRDGGGIVRVGGGYQGKAKLPNATQTYIDKEATITASATQSGDAGRVIVWSNDKTGFYGRIEATSTNGTGGFVETSGHQFDALGTVTTQSLTGKTGTWLLDPNDITISAAADTGTMTWTGAQFQDAVAAASNLNTTTLQNRLLTNNVIVTTAPGAGGTGNLTLSNPVTWSSGNSLTLFASNDLSINSSITYSGAANNTLTLQANNIVSVSGTGSILANGTGKLDVTLNSDRDGVAGGPINMSSGSSITSNGGDIKLVGGVAAIGYATGIGAGSSAGINLTGTQLSSGAGSILVNGLGWSNGATSSLYGIFISANSVVQSTSGTITINGTGGAGISSNYGLRVNGVATKVSTATGAMNITAQGGAGTGTSNYGMMLDGAGTIESTSLVAGAGTITVNGTGGVSGGSDFGLRISGANSKITSSYGNILVNGKGANTAGANNFGVYLDLTGEISSTGTGAGAATVTLNGTGGAGTSANNGIYIISAARVSSQYGNILLNGTGGGSGTLTSNQGVSVNTGIVESTGTGAGAAMITINGTGGNGTGSDFGSVVTGVGGRVSSVMGNISISGLGGTGTGGDKEGIIVSATGVVESTGTGAGAATITMNGTGGANTSSNYGVSVSGASTRVTSTSGNIIVNGTGGAASTTNNYGVLVVSGAKIESLGVTNPASITVFGTGGSGTSANHGVIVNTGTPKISSVNGAISITGIGGGTTTNNNGIELSGSGYVESTGDNAGAVILNGTGGNGTSTNRGIWVVNAGSKVWSKTGNVTMNGLGRGSGTDNYGILLQENVTSTGTAPGAATLTLNGTGGNGTNLNYGLYLTGAGGIITSQYGNIIANGTGGNGAGTSNYGTYIAGGAFISSTGTSAGSATITVNGTGGNGLGGDIGLRVQGAGAKISSNSGNILLNGRAGSNVAAANSMIGIYVDTGGVIESLGTGPLAATITANGTGGLSPTLNYGVYATGANAKITSQYGNILINGIGGGNGTGIGNYGVQITSGGAIESTGTSANAATITVNGTGGSGTSTNMGLRVSTASARISSLYGNILLSGTGGAGTLTSNVGVYVDTTAKVESTGVGASGASVSIRGTGGSGTTSTHGFYISTTNANVSSVDGAIDITGVAGGVNSAGIMLPLDAQINSTGTASITMRGTGTSASDISVSGGTNIIGGATANGNISLIGDTISLANFTLQTQKDVIIRPRTSGTLMGIGSPAVGLNITDAILGSITHGGTLWLGDTTNTGTMTINTARVFNKPVVFATRQGSDILLNGTLSSTAPGNALTLASGANFQNTAGASALSAPAGNWRVFSTRPELNAKNGLSATELFGINYPYGIGGSNFFLYSYTPPSTGTGWVGGGSVTTDPLPPVEPVILPTTPVTTVPTTSVVVIPTVPDPVFLPVTVDIPPLIFHPVAIYSEQSITSASHDSLSYTTQNQSGPSRARSNELKVEVEKGDGAAGGTLSFLCDDSHKQQARCDLKW